MTPQEFHRELLNLPKVSDRFLAEARALRKKYPYFQALPLIIALGENQRNDPKAIESLHTAAAFAADRGLLKEQMNAAAPLIVTSAKTETSDVVTEPAEGTVTEPAAVTVAEPVEATATKPVEVRVAEPVEATPSEHPETPEVTAPGTFADRVLSGLGELRERMNQFTEQVHPSRSDIQPPSGLAETMPAAAEQETAYTAEGKEEKEKKEKKEPRETAKDPSDKLLDEIKSKRKRQKPDSDRQVEQMELIDKFISNKPSRRPSRKTVTEKTTEPAAAPEPPPPAGQDNYSENVISETLVDLLIRQGKKEKAIEVLRKLIWKFPQKKALFAARIQELSQ